MSEVRTRYYEVQQKGTGTFGFDILCNLVDPDGKIMVSDNDNLSKEDVMNLCARELNRMLGRVIEMEQLIIPVVMQQYIADE